MHFSICIINRTLYKAIKVQKLIKIQRSFRGNARDVNKAKVGLIVSTLCGTVKRIKRDIDGELFSIIERTTVYVCTANEIRH